MRLVQILGEGIEELYNVPDGVDDEQIKTAYTEYYWNNSYDDNNFEEAWNNDNPLFEIERVYVDEIYID